MRSTLLLALLVALLLVAGPASAQTTPGLRARLATLVREAGLGDQVGVQVAHASDGEIVFASRSDLPLNPASNMKVVTAAGALLRLGPGFQMQTGLYGRVVDGRVDTLVLRGFGDPSLRISDLVELAAALADRGVRAVGEIVVDGSYFDDQILPPAFEQQPDEAAAFRAAIGAVAVERASFVLRVLPGPSIGSEARVRLVGADYFELSNRMTTSEGGAPNVIASQSALEGGRMQLNLRGSVPAGILGVSYRRRIENPLLHAGYCMVEALERAGIRARSRVRLGHTPHGTPLLTSRTSAPLATLLHALGKHSDNFVAEMILKVLGAERSRPGSSARGAEVLQEVLGEVGVPEGAATIVNGSGLFEGNRIAASHLVAVLRHMHGRAALRAEFLAHLAIGAEDGTLRRRLRGLPAPRIVRAKTGTLNDAIALSGYVLGPRPESTVAFSFLANGVRGRQGAARNLADAIASAIAEDLYR